MYLCVIVCVIMCERDVANGCARRDLYGDVRASIKNAVLTSAMILSPSASHFFADMTTGGGVSVRIFSNEMKERGKYVSFRRVGMRVVEMNVVETCTHRRWRGRCQMRVGSSAALYL